MRERTQGVEMENVGKHGRCVTSGLLMLASAEDLLRGSHGESFTDSHPLLCNGYFEEQETEGGITT